MSPVIEMSDVGKRFGTHWVLAHLNLSIQKGESVALFGRNGSGKSTLLKIIATLISPSTGSLKILGGDVDRQRAEIRKKIRFLTHEKQLYGSLTALENLKLAAGLRGLSAGETSRQLGNLLDRLQIKKLEGQRVSQLSEGMKKRVVLARLLIGKEEPELILLDEPHPTLDVEGRKILDTLIQEWRSQGKTILLASHDHAQALTHVDRLIILEEKKINYDGPPRADR